MVRKKKNNLNFDQVPRVLVDTVWASAQELILTPNMATSRSISRRLSRGSLAVAIPILIRPSDYARPSARLLVAHLNMVIG